MRVGTPYSYLYIDENNLQKLELQIVVWVLKGFVNGATWHFRRQLWISRARY